MTKNMNLLKLDITDNQKNIIIMSFSILLVFLLFGIFLYLPASKEISMLKQELNLTEQQIQGIDLLLTGSQGQNEAILLLKKQQQDLDSKFPQKEEESLNLITEIARKMNITIISLQSGAKTELLGVSGKQTVIENRLAHYIPITLEVTCFYKDLVKYLLELKLELPAFVSVVSLSVKKEDRSSGRVRAITNFNLYLLI